MSARPREVQALVRAAKAYEAIPDLEHLRLLAMAAWMAAFALRGHVEDV